MGYSTKAISFFVKLEQTECQQIYTRLMSNLSVSNRNHQIAVTETDSF